VQSRSFPLCWLMVVCLSVYPTRGFRKENCQLVSELSSWMFVRCAFLVNEQSEMRRTACLRLQLPRPSFNSSNNPFVCMQHYHKIIHCTRIMNRNSQGVSWEIHVKQNNFCMWTLEVWIRFCPQRRWACFLSAS
jgi:hypothetical protein